MKQAEDVKFRLEDVPGSLGHRSEEQLQDIKNIFVCSMKFFADKYYAQHRHGYNLFHEDSFYEAIEELDILLDEIFYSTHYIQYKKEH